jgi:hypothetical protein
MTDTLFRAVRRIAVFDPGILMHSETSYLKGGYRAGSSSPALLQRMVAHGATEPAGRMGSEYTAMERSTS